MGLYNVVNRTTMQSGQPEDISQVLANFDAIAAILNGNLEDVNVKAAAAIALSKLAGYPADGTKFAAGDGTWKVPGGGMVTLMDYTVAGAAAATVDTNTVLGGNIPQGYANLRVVMIARGDTVAGTTTANLRFNNDSSAAYDYQDLLEDGVTLTGTRGAGNTWANLASIAAASAAANHPGIADIFIPGYSGAIFAKLATSKNAFHNSGTGITDHEWGVRWNNTAPITRITFLPGAGNFVIGSRFVIYGY